MGVAALLDVWGRSWAGPERGSEILCVLTHGMGSTPPPHHHHGGDVDGGGDDDDGGGGNDDDGGGGDCGDDDDGGGGDDYKVLSDCVKTQPVLCPLYRQM